MPVNVYIDVSSLACPMATSSSDHLVSDLEQYINDLVFIKDHLDSTLFRFFSARDLPEALFSTGLYPVLNDIKYMLELTGLAEVYQAKDVNRLFDLLFKKMPFAPLPVIENATFSELTVTPPLNHLENDELKEKQIIELGKAAASKQSGWLKTEDLIIFGHFIVEEGSDKPLTDVRGTMQKAEFCKDWLCSDIRFPIAFAEMFPSIRRIATLTNEMDTALEASQCNSDDQLGAVLSVAISQAGEKGERVRGWSLGSSFFDSLEALHLRNDKTAIRGLVDALVDTVLRKNLPQTHHLRKNAGGNSAPQTDGAAVAWRRDVGHEYHIHYWEVGGECEFATVVVHGNMTIPNCGLTRVLN